jgi:ubiquinone/menaquinone biosynthesis C-methylase UbiE
MSNNWTQTRQPAFDRGGALKMNETAKTVFAPIYPVIARNAMTVTGITRGVCLDLGSGPAMLAMAVAREAPQMQVIAFDFSPDARQIALENIAEAHLSERIRYETGDVHAMPFEDGFADLIVSRGSMFFWKDLSGAFREILRILAPGGATYIGGGFGNLALKEQIIAEMLKRDPTWDCYAKKKTDADGIRRFEEMFAELGCRTYRIIDDDSGFWIVLSKSK